jgi:N-acyl-D-aspartate/D-glutamate deacylase
LKKEISRTQRAWENIYLGSGGPSGVLISAVVNRELEPLQGKRISEIAAEQKKDPDGPLAGSKSHPRGWGTYPRILGRYVREERLLSLETAIHKMTGAPAARVGLRDRGLIRAGMFADITVFDPNKVMDRATFEMPNQYPAGIEYVLVNGDISVEKGQRTAALGGRALRGPGYKR